MFKLEITPGCLMRIFDSHSIGVQKIGDVIVKICTEILVVILFKALDDFRIGEIKAIGKGRMTADPKVRFHRKPVQPGHPWWGTLKMTVFSGIFSAMLSHTLPSASPVNTTVMLLAVIANTMELLLGLLSI